MPETHDLDRAFEALARDVMERTVAPPARAAIGRARRRRRTTLAFTAAAVAVVVGGVAVPTLGAGRLGLGFADGLPQAAALDAAALRDATDGWIAGWEAGASDGSFAAPDCVPDGQDPPTPETGGTSWFAGAEHSGTSMVITGYADAAGARAAWSVELAGWARCAEASRTDTPAYPAGTEVVHYRVDLPAATEPGARLSDVWVARSGAELGVLETATAAGPADPSAVDAVSDALVAGLLDGAVQEEWDPALTDPPRRPQLPPVDARDLRAALAGWRSTTRVDVADLPAAPCRPSVTRGVSAMEQTSPQGSFVSVDGYEEGSTRASQELDRAVAALRDCPGVQQRPALPGGVALFTYDVGGRAGHGAVWLAANEDRVMVVAVDGVAGPLPDEVGARVAGFLTDVLALPWPGAS